MALALSDFKKTTRTTDLGRQLYPHQLRDDRYLSAINFAINYYEQMMGRRREDFDSNALLEFFGDPKLARGIVACLGRYYHWHQPTFAEVLSSTAWEIMQHLQLTQAYELRALLYSHANQFHHGFLLPNQRPAALADLCQSLPIEPDEYEELLRLDEEAVAILVRNGAIPEASDIIAAYNFHSLETALRHATSLTLTLSGAVWPMMLSVRNVARRYKLEFEIVEGPRDLFGQHIVVTWHGKKDALGSWSRHGRKLIRGVLRLLAAHPDCPLHGVAAVSLGGRNMIVKLSARELTTLGVAARSEGKGAEVWHTTLDTNLAQLWSRSLSKSQTANWRLRRDPEPLILDTGVLVPNFVALRGTQRVAVFIPATAATLEHILNQLKQINSAIVVAPAEIANAFEHHHIPLVTYTESPEIAKIIACLEQHFPDTVARQAVDRWSRLHTILQEQGFVADSELVDILGCRSVEEAVQAVQTWRTKEVQYVPGLGLCTREQLKDLRTMLQNRAA